MENKDCANPNSVVDDGVVFADEEENLNQGKEKVMEKQKLGQEGEEEVVVVRKQTFKRKVFVKKGESGYKKIDDQIRFISSKYAGAFQKLLDEGEKNVTRFMLFDSKGNCNDMRKSLKATRGMSESRKYICRVDVALLSMKKDLALILYNEYFFPAGSKWWMHYYSRSAYYRLRLEAIKTFLDVFNLWKK